MDKAREEFFSEAQELVEAFSRNLLALDAAQKSGQDDPSLVNEAFRAVHTLKGLAGLFGAKKMTMLSHRLEEVLDRLRLGRLRLSAGVLDRLFAAVDGYTQLLSAEKRRSDDPVPTVDELVESLDALGEAASSDSSPLSAFELDPAMLAVLTEYEEHRLRENVQRGRHLYRLRVEFDLATIDRALEELKAQARPHGEVITYLPTGSARSADTIELDLLMASASSLEELTSALGSESIAIERVVEKAEQEGSATMPPPTSLINDVEAEARGSIEPATEEGAMPELALEPGGVLRAVAQTVRVDIRKLDGLMNAVGELAIVKSSLARIAERLRAEGNRQLGSELYRIHRSFDRRLGELQGGILEVRMVPLGQVFDRLARVVRQISRDMSKEIRLVITGAETEIDKLIVEELSDPLMHIVRNAIDHGIESSDERQRAGKPQAGTIALNAFQKGNHVVIEIEDDGGGVDEQALVDRAVALGHLDPRNVHELSRVETLNLLFLPGLTTRDVAGDYSGRGVGMDVVKTNIARLGGIIDVHSEARIGTKLTITLPVTLAIVSALLVRVEGDVFAIPLASVSEAIYFDPSAVRMVEGREVMTLRGATLPICRLGRLFDLEARDSESPRRRYVVVTTLGARRLGLVVDHLLGQQDIVIKSLGKSLTGLRGFAGATELGDQRVALVLDAAGLIEEVLTGLEATREARALAYG